MASPLVVDHTAQGEENNESISDIGTWECQIARLLASVSRARISLSRAFGRRGGAPGRASVSGILIVKAWGSPPS